MTARSLAHVGLSLIGVYALTQALVMFPALATTASTLFHLEEGRAMALWVAIAPFGVLILIACLLVTQPGTIASWLSPPPPPDSAPEVSVSVTVSLFATAGLLLYASALPGLLQVVFFSANETGQTPSLTWIASPLFRVLLGLFLFFRPATVVKFWESKASLSNAKK